MFRPTSTGLDYASVACDLAEILAEESVDGSRHRQPKRVDSGWNIALFLPQSKFNLYYNFASWSHEQYIASGMSQEGNL